MPSVDDILGPGGAIARRLKGYEPRPEQLAMARAVEKAIETGGTLMVEAGTGVGKSFAYLVPALLAATREKDPIKVVVSTNTIGLQEQLILKDVPFLRSLWHDEFSALLVKGRSNYISRRRAFVAAQRAQGQLFEQEAYDQLGLILDWMDKTDDGSLADLAFKPLPVVWEQVRSEHGNCLGKSCPEHEKCHYFSARRRVWNANLLVVNHALFFSDLALRQNNVSILPEYQVAIFDEGHTLEDIAADHFGLNIASTQVEYQLSRLFNERTQKGLLARPELKGARELVNQTRWQVDDFFRAVAEWQVTSGPTNGRVRSKGIVADALTEPLRTLARKIGEGAEEIEKETERIELTAASGRLLDLAADVRAWLDHEDDEGVHWIETGPRQRTTLCSSPIEVAPRLAEHLWNKVPTSIVTSATLSTGAKGDFRFFQKRLGADRATTLAVGSPFDYPKQATLHLFRDLPDPSTRSAEFEEATLALIPWFLDMTRGHAFVLFTSYRALRSAAERLGPWCVERGYPLFSQADDMPRTKLLDEYRKTPGAVLFGTDSFWQGVDVRGEQLQMVVIPKLPFAVPDRAPTEARLERIRERGGNPFSDHTLPEAIVKLKQGFGRLIRTKTDTGHVVILDPRMTTKPYGRQFLDALPNATRLIHSRREFGV